MRLTTCLFASVLLATPALAQSPSGNVSQPERAVPQAGNTSNGPINKPSTRDMPPATGAVTVPGAESGISPGAGAVDSAKGGNASDPNRAVPNTGSTSGGPAR